MYRALVGPFTIVQNSDGTQVLVGFMPLANLERLITHLFSDHCDENIQDWAISRDT